MHYKCIRDFFRPFRSEIVVAKDSSCKNPIATIVCDHSGLNVTNHKTSRECNFSDAFIQSIFQISNGTHFPYAINRCLEKVA